MGMVSHSPPPPPAQDTERSDGKRGVSAPDVAVPSNDLVPTTGDLMVNASYGSLTKPSHGPENPTGQELMRKTVMTGAAEETAIAHSTFAKQHLHFLRTGRAYDGTDLPEPTREERAGHRRKRQKSGNVAVMDGEDAYRGPWARYQSSYESSSPFASSEEDNSANADAIAVQKPIWVEREQTESVVKEEKSIFHGKEEHDYLGRTYLHVPQTLEIKLDKTPMSFETFFPKKQIHTWRGHTKGISTLRFLPTSGHLLLSASLDAKIMLWEAFESRSLLRTNYGHTKGVCDVVFSADGTSFISASYDKTVKLWSTETGQVLSRYEIGSIAHCVVPNPRNKDEFLVGTVDRRILQYDTRSGEVVQEYNHHLGPVNTLTFCDQGRRFISTSDDKSLRAWDYSIPTPIKYLAEPHMHSLTSVALHPSDKYFIAQSMDNQVMVFSTEKFRQHKRKAFRGHSCNGSQVQCSVSADGQWVASGDTNGYLCVWDWKTGKMVKKLKAHEGVANCALWHPQESSKVATGGADGVICYWD